MQKNSLITCDSMNDDFFDPVDALPFVPDPVGEAVHNDVILLSRTVEQRFQSIQLLLIREYERVLREGAVRQRAEIVRRSASAGLFTDSPLDRKARRELYDLERDITEVLSAEEKELFEDFRKRLITQYEWSLEYTRKFCEKIDRIKLREWISIVYDE